MMVASQTSSRQTQPTATPATPAAKPSVAGGLFAACESVLDLDTNCLCFGAANDVKAPRKTNTCPTGPPLALRVGYAPGVESAGARLGPFGLGDDIAVTKIEQCKGLEVLAARSQRGAAGAGSRNFMPQDGLRFTMQQSHFRARVCVSDGRGGFEEYWCLLSTANSPKDRTIENVQVAVDDAVIAASYAHRFNEQTANLHREEEGGEHDADSVVGVRVCIPVGAYVIGGTEASVAQPGQAISLALYPFKEAHKYVYDGGEDFAELPQAFFHYCCFLSNGREVIADIQGYEDEDGDIFLVDPVVIRPSQPTVGSLLGTLTHGGNGGGAGVPGQCGEVEKMRFDAWHPKCGQLCKAFDATRRGGHVRRACGLAVPSCGVGGA